MYLTVNKQQHYLEHIFLFIWSGYSSSM